MISGLRRTLKRQVSRTASIPAPTGGLNARDAIANMPETDAIMMDNWFPSPSSVDIRKGYFNWSTGLPGWVETLAAYNSPTAHKLFSVSAGGIYDSTIQGAVGAAVVTSLTNSRFQFTNIGTTGGNFLLMVNGADKLRGFDGTSWWTDGDGAHDITGVNTSTIIHINLFKNRLWMTQKNSFKVWYLATQSIAGSVSGIDLSTIFHLGGHLVGMTNWTIDNVSGINDYAVFITSEGEFAVYNGTDPSSADTWALVGVFRVGDPVGLRSFIKVGSDVIVVTEDGVFPLSKALLTERTQLNEAISNKITNLISSDVQSYSGNFGWQPILYPLGNKLFINVPQVENSVQYQYVMNTITGSWCRFTGWNAACFETMQNSLYFGGNGLVAVCDTGTDDNGANINSSVKQAFSYFKQRGRIKRFTMARPIFTSSGIINAAIALSMDFGDKTPTSTPTFSGTSGSPWDTSPWNTSPWGPATGIVRNWQTVSGTGYAAALRMDVASKGVSASWQSTDFVYEPGGVL